MTKRYSLVADIGGTNTRVALAEGTALQMRSVQKYKNADHPSLEAVLRHYLGAQGSFECAGACVALAGPVTAGRGSLTNLDWEIDEATLARASNADHVALLNDLQAHGHALGNLPDANVPTLVDADSTEPSTTKLVVNVGTGFNVAPVYEAEGVRLVPPSEAGHANLPVRHEDELSMLQFFETSHGFPAVEDMLSGRGLERCYAWVSSTKEGATQKQGFDIMASLKDGSDPIAEEAARLFARMLGTVSGNLSLIHLPFGGVYLAGGVARAFAPYLDRYGFTAAFRDKGRFESFMRSFPVRVIDDDFAALVGCACYLERSTATPAS